MPSEFWEEVESLFEEVLELTETQRHERLCEYPNPEVCREVQQLLEYTDHNDARLDLDSGSLSHFVATALDSQPLIGSVEIDPSEAKSSDTSDAHDKSEHRSDDALPQQGTSLGGAARSVDGLKDVYAPSVSPSKVEAWSHRGYLFSDSQAFAGNTRSQDSNDSRLQRLSLSEIERLIANELRTHYPHYTNLERIGVGGQAVVFRAMDRQLQRSVALRTSRFATRRLDGEPSTLESRTESFVAESQRICQIRSEHVIQVYDVHVRGELPFQITEFVDGTNLMQLIVKRGALAPRMATELMEQVTRGVVAAHEAGLVHGDLKPSNILLSPDNDYEFGYRAIVADFGLCRFDTALIGILNRESEENIVSKPSFDEGFVCGTLPFMCPEILEGSSHSLQSDVYSLGVTLYEMLTGTLPYRGAKHVVLKQIRAGQPTMPRSIDEAIPRDLEAVTLKSFARLPSERYPSAALLNDDLKRFLRGLSTRARPAGLVQNFTSWTTRNIAVLAPVACCLLLSALLLYFANSAYQKSLDLIAAERASQRIKQDAATEMLLNADHSVVKEKLAEGFEITPAFATKLQNLHQRTGIENFQRLNAALITLDKADDETAAVDAITSFLSLAPDVYRTSNLLQAFVYAAEPTWRSQAVAAIRESLDTTGLPAEVNIDFAILAFALGDYAPLEKICSKADDPSLAIAMARRICRWHPDVETLCRTFKNSPASVRYHLLLGIGFFEPLELKNSDRRRIEALLIHCVTSPESTAAEILAARWCALQLDIPTAYQQTPSSSNLRTITSNSDYWMVRLPPTTTFLGSFQEKDDYPTHEVTFTKALWVSCTETPVSLYESFLNDPDYPRSKKPDHADNFVWDREASPTKNHPVNSVSWFDACLFCNWLSSKNGLTTVYQFQSPVSSENELANDFEVEIDYSADGFRLPSEAELEFAIRGGAQTKHWIGQTRDSLETFVRLSADEQLPSIPCGSFPPNRYGIHEGEGNVWEWAEEWIHNHDDSPLTDPRIPLQPVLTDFEGKLRRERIYRGGGINTLRGSATCYARGESPPTVRYSNLGFRVVLPGASDATESFQDEQ